MLKGGVQREHIFRMGDTDIEEQLTELSKLLESGDDSEQDQFKDLLARHREGREDEVFINCNSDGE